MKKSSNIDDVISAHRAVLVLAVEQGRILIPSMRKWLAVGGMGVFVHGSLCLFSFQKEGVILLGLPI